MVQVVLGDFGEVGPFGEVLTDEAVGVFVDGTFVGAVGVGEVDVEAKFLGELFVLGEFFSVVYGEGVAQVPGDVYEGSYSGLVEDVGRSVVHEDGLGIEEAPFGKGSNRPFVATPNHGIAFPVARTFLGVHDGGPHIDRDAIGDGATIFFATAALASLLVPVSQMLVKTASRALVSIDELVNRLVRNPHATIPRMLQRQHGRYTGGFPILL